MLGSCLELRKIATVSYGVEVHTANRPQTVGTLNQFQGITLSTSKMSEITHEVAKVFTKSRACPRKIYGGCRQFVEITCEALGRKGGRRGVNC